MAAPYTLENTIRALDEAVYGWLGKFPVNYGEVAGVARDNFPLLRVFASPHRAFAQVADLLVAQNWIAGDSVEMQRAKANVEWTILPLPVASIERDDPIIDNSLANTAASWRRMQVTRDGKYIDHQYPLHYLTQYRITFWCEKRYTHAAFMEWILSQLGLRGSPQSEILLPVQHAEPWGVQLHQLRYLGSADLSDLEGNDARHIRSMLSFTLRSWAFRTPDLPNDAIFTTQQEYNVDADPKVTDATFEPFPDNGQWGSNNLFTLVPWDAKKVAKSWASSGFAKVRLTDEQAVHATLTVPGDAVAISAFPAVRDAFGRTTWGIAARFVADQPFSFQVTAPQKDGSEKLMADIRIPAGTTDFHKFFTCDDEWVAFSVAFADAQAEVEFSNVDIRQLSEVARISYTAAAPGATTTDYIWSGLEKRPYLLVGYFARPDASGTGSVVIADDAVAPTTTKTALVNTDDFVGFAEVSMPVTDSLRLTVPAGFRFTVLHARVFDGPWRGSSI